MSKDESESGPFKEAIDLVEDTCRTINVYIADINAKHKYNLPFLTLLTGSSTNEEYVNTVCVHAP